MRLDECRRRLALALDLPDYAGWNHIVYQAEKFKEKRNIVCEHEWMARGTPDDKWWECFLCGGTAD